MTIENGAVATQTQDHVAQVRSGLSIGLPPDGIPMITGRLPLSGVEFATLRRWIRSDRGWTPASGNWRR